MSNSYKNFFTHLIVVLVLLFDLSLQSIIETSKTQYKLNSNQTIHLIKETRSIGITKISACKVELDNKKIIDLSSLDKESNPRKSPDQFNQYDFEFNPCSPIICETGKPKTAAICQKAKFGNVAYDCGDQSTAAFAYDGTSLTITFTAGIKRTAMVCICGETEAFQYVNEQPVNNYALKFTSPCCCPDRCKGGSGGGTASGLSFGSILLIIFFTVLPTYFMVGIIYMKFSKKATGVEIIPNSSFWVSIPSNIKNGFSFTVSKIRRGGSYTPI